VLFGFVFFLELPREVKLTDTGAPTVCQ
jgi:hypothetical protein